VEGKTDGRDFRINLDFAGKGTVLFTRWEPETLDGPGPGFGSEFAKVSTMPAKGCEKATGHHRVVTYTFAGLKMLVRFSVDACIPEKAPRSSPDVDDVLSAFSSLSVSGTSNARTNTAPHGVSFGSLNIIPVGKALVPQSTLVELKTRSAKNVQHFDWKSIWPQLYICRTPYLFIAVHEGGMFEEVLTMKLGSSDPVVQSAAEKAKDGLNKLGIALTDIVGRVIDEAKNGEGRSLSLICRGGKMELHERAKKGGIPDELLRYFD